MYQQESVQRLKRNISNTPTYLPSKNKVEAIKNQIGAYVQKLMLLRKLQMHYENKNTAITRQSKNFIASHQSQIKQFIHLVALQFTGSPVYKELVKLYKDVYERDIFHSSLGALYRGADETLVKAKRRFYSNR